MPAATDSSDSPEPDHPRHPAGRLAGFLLLMALFGWTSGAQAQQVPGVARHSIETETVRAPATTDDEADALSERLRQVSIQYVDARGRARQSVQRRMTPSGRDLIQPTVYDSLGRKTRSWLPFADDDSTGNFRASDRRAVRAFYARERVAYEVGGSVSHDTTSVPYAELRREQSAVDRKDEAGGVGYDWQIGRQTTRYGDGTNERGEVYDRRATDSGIDLRGPYPATTLYKKVVTDPNGDRMVTYKNQEGERILKQRFFEDGRVASTYYVYDRDGNLRFIIPPKLVAQKEGADGSGAKDWTLTAAEIDAYVTEYRYDAFDRKVVEIIPEEEPMYTVYDRLGRPVLKQDGIMRDNDDWLFTKYDRYGRVVVTGIWRDTSGTATRSDLQDRYDAATRYHERPAAPPDDPNVGADTLGYTNAVFPTAPLYVWTVHYYDDYDFDADGTSDAALRPVDAFPARPATEATYYDSVAVDGFAATDRVVDRETRVMRRVFQRAPGRVFPSGTYDFCPSEPDSLFYPGEVELIPEFETRKNQEICFGPSCEVPADFDPQESRGGEPPTYDNQRTGRWLTETRFFDDDERVIQRQKTHFIGGMDVVSTQYTFDGKPRRVVKRHATRYADVTVRERYVYDRAGRAFRTWRKHDDDPWVLAVESIYNELGEQVEKRLHSTDGGQTFAQYVDYRRNARGQLTHVNDLAGTAGLDADDAAPDLLQMRFTYGEAADSLGAEPRYDGTVAAMQWKTALDTLAGGHAYGYQYDGLGRLTDARYRAFDGGPVLQDRYTVDNLTYDLNGNIRTVRRHGTGGTIDDLTYRYRSSPANQLQAVTDTAPTTDSLDYPSTGAVSGDPAQRPPQFTYDANGNRTADSTRGLYATYSYLNVPDQVRTDSTERIEWYWAAGGEKLAKLAISAGDTVGTYYASDFVYEANPAEPDPQLRLFRFGEGRITSEPDAGGEASSGGGKTPGTAYAYEYHLKDHLGNTRIAFTPDSSGAAVVVQHTGYYPYGLRFAGVQPPQTTASGNEYLYNDKELAEEFGLNWYHYGARYYDVALARWAEMDPADEFHTPYAYVGGDPVNLVDPDGRQAINSQELRARVRAAGHEGEEAIHDAVTLGISEQLNLRPNLDHYRGSDWTATPDASGTQVVSREIGLGPLQLNSPSVFFPESVFLEVKTGSSARVNLYAEGGQIQKQINTLGNSYAAKAGGHGALILVTPKGVGVHPPVLTYATQKNVAVYQSTFARPMARGDLAITAPRLQNPNVLSKGKGYRYPFTLGPWSPIGMKGAGTDSSYDIHLPRPE